MTGLSGTRVTLTLENDKEAVDLVRGFFVSGRESWKQGRRGVY